MAILVSSYFSSSNKSNKFNKIIVVIYANIPVKTIKNINEPTNLNFLCLKASLKSDF